MPISFRCPGCDAAFKVPEAALGRKSRCPKCGDSILITRPDSVSVAVEPAVIATPREVDSESLDDLDTPSDLPRKKWKKKKKSKDQKVGFFERMADGQNSNQIMRLVIGGLFFVLGYFAVDWLFGTPTPATIGDSAWEKFEVPGRFKCLVPGPPEKSTQSINGMSFVMYKFPVDKNTYYGVAYTDSPLPRDRATLPDEQLLNDACDGSLRNTKEIGSEEVSRDSITLGGHAGKHFVMRATRLNGQMISDVYIVNKRMVMLMAAGKGYKDGQANVKKFLSSLEIFDKPGEDSPKPDEVAEAPRGRRTGPVAPPPPVKRRPVQYNPPNRPDYAVVEPPAIEAETTVPLPGPVSGIKVAGGGRYLALLLEGTRTIALFDVQTLKIDREISCGAAVNYTATAKELIVYETSKKSVDRYDLATGKLSGSQLFGVAASRIESFSAGHASAGPLCISSNPDGMNFYDVETLKPISELSWPRGHYAMNATGLTALDRGMGGPTSALHAFRFQNSLLMEFDLVKPPPAYAIPGPDDRFAYFGGFGIGKSNLEDAANVPTPYATVETLNRSHMYLPAATGNYYFHAVVQASPADSFEFGRVQIYRHGSVEPLMTIPKTPLTPYSNWKITDRMGFEETIHLIPDAKVLIVLGEGRKELKIYPVMLDEGK